MNDFIELSDHVVVAVDEIAAVRWCRYSPQMNDPGVVVTLKGSGKEFGRWWQPATDAGVLSGSEILRCNQDAEAFYRAVLRHLPSLTVDLETKRCGVDVGSMASRSRSR